MKTASLAYIAGYLVRTVQERVSCMACLDCISLSTSNSPLMSLIVHQDLGKLRYPKPSFVSVLEVIQEFVEKAVPCLPNKNVLEILSSQIIQILARCPLLQCPICDQNRQKELACIIAEKFIRPLLDNIAANITEKLAATKHISYKPLSRKILRL